LSTLESEVNAFTVACHNTPLGRDLRRAASDNPVTVKQISDNQLRQVDTDKAELITKIDTNKNLYPQEEGKLDGLKAQVIHSADKAKEVIKETNNASVEYIDDSSDTEHLIYNSIPFIVSLESIPLFSIIITLFKICSDSMVRRFLSIQYSINKNRIEIIFTLCLSVISLLVISLSVISVFIDFNVIGCDAPRA